MPIKTSTIKRTSRNLLKEDNVFTSEFNENKKILSNLMPSKSVRNKIAGYIARLKKKEAEGEKIIE